MTRLRLDLQWNEVTRMKRGRKGVRGIGGGRKATVGNRRERGKIDGGKVSMREDTCMPRELGGRIANVGRRWEKEKIDGGKGEGKVREREGGRIVGVGNRWEREKVNG